MRLLAVNNKSNKTNSEKRILHFSCTRLQKQHSSLMYWLKICEAWVRSQLCWAWNCLKLNVTSSNVLRIIMHWLSARRDVRLTKGKLIPKKHSLYRTLKHSIRQHKRVNRTWHKVTPCYPLLPFVLPLVTLVTPCYPLLPLLPLLPLVTLVTLVTPCYTCYPLLPFLPLITLVTPCYPLLPLVTLVTLVTPCYPCYTLLPLLPLLPLVTPCYPLLPLLHLVTPCYPCYPLLPL